MNRGVFVGQGRGRGPALLAATVMLAVLAPAMAAAQQDLGHRAPGSLGLYAGSQQGLGLYASDRFLWFSADRLYDRNGHLVPAPGYNENTFFNTAGVFYTFELEPLRAHVSAGISLSGGRTTVSEINPASQSDHAGLGDIYVQPLNLGWRLPHVDITTSYAFYAPTGSFRFGALRDGEGEGHWAHELAAGGTLYFDRDRTWSVSALGTVVLNQRDRGVDVTHGSIVNLEGGIGKRLFGVLDFGVAGFAGWQVEDDRGADVPPMLLGVRSHIYALGPEADVTIDKLRCVLSVRYEQDFHVQARPAGQSLVTTLTFNPWAPHSPKNNAPNASPAGGAAPAPRME